MAKSQTNGGAWKYFQDAGLLWWTNRLLHTFGWAIVFTVDDDDNVIDVRPERVVYRGFPRDAEVEGFRRITEHMMHNAVILRSEIE